LSTVDIKLKNSSKLYSFNSNNLELEKDMTVVVCTAKGLECGTVESVSKHLQEKKCDIPLKSIVRVATQKDIEDDIQNQKAAQENKVVAMDIIQKSGLKMNVLEAEYTLDREKLLFYFTAQNRIDFRELVKNLAKQFKTYIELKQVKEQQEKQVKEQQDIKNMNIIGTCGRQCCCSFGVTTHSTVKMVKNQNLSLNPNQTLGMCGKIKCCMSFENEHYADVNKRCPKVGSGCCDCNGRCGTVAQINYLKETVKVKFTNNEDEVEVVDYPIGQIKKQ
jgi:cell fate regulator YaaT (PSP1 superfamily)